MRSFDDQIVCVALSEYWGFFVARKLSDWVGIAEIVSSLAVVITLIFLLFDIRENTDITRAAVYDRNMDSLNDWRLAIAKDKDLTRVFIHGQTDRVGESMTDQELEAAQYMLISNVQWGIYEKSYYAHQYETLGTGEWSRFEQQICTAWNRATAISQWNQAAGFLTNEFKDYVIGSCQE